MSTAPKTFSTKPVSDSLSRQQLRRDRIQALIVLAVATAIFALMFWLASIGNGPPPEVNDYWHLMP